MFRPTLLLAGFAFLAVVGIVQMQGLGVPGGLSQEKVADKEIIDLVQKLKPTYEKKLTRSHTEFTPLKYRSQTVAGTNYFVKVRTAPGEFIHLSIHDPIRGDAILMGVQSDKKENDKIEHFGSNLIDN